MITITLSSSIRTLITKAHIFSLFIDNIVFWEYISFLLSIRFVVVDSSHLQMLTICHLCFSPTTTIWQFLNNFANLYQLFNAIVNQFPISKGNSTYLKCALEFYIFPSVLVRTYYFGKHNYIILKKNIILRIQCYERKIFVKKN